LIRNTLIPIVMILLFVLLGCTQQPVENDNSTSRDELIQNEPSGEEATKKTENEYQRIKVKLENAVDGDTIEILYNGKSESVRFLLVDTPETSHPRLGKQPFGEEAKAFTAQIVQNANELELEFDIGPQRDKYGRLLAYIYADGKMVQEELLKQGLARVAYIYPPSTRYVDPFRALQEQAQQAGIGIWEIENYAQEDGFHKEFVEDNSTKEKEIESNPSCSIKGNVSSSGDKIYHTPESPWYEQTKPEMIFCTEDEAKQAGFRAPK
jgi:micrococcal nuclease